VGKQDGGFTVEARGRHPGGMPGMKIGKVTPSFITDLWKEVEPRIREAPTLEAACQSLAETIFLEFEESVALARVFFTVPFDRLTPIRRRFVQELARGAGVEGSLRTATPVLSLVGTFGVEEEWRDPLSSERHLGIPLVSMPFVDAIPMISRLLKDLGIPLEWAETCDTATIERTVGRTAELFFVEDAAQALDQHGRKIISAQEFVSGYGIRGVFGVGGGYIGGQILVLIVFCRDGLKRTAAETFMATTALFKAKTATLVGEGRIFRR
jgi:hypothetical protein